MVAYEQWLIRMATQLEKPNESLSETMANIIISHCINGNDLAYDFVEKHSGTSKGWTRETFYLAASDFLTQNQESC